MRRTIFFIIVLALVAAACGSGTDTVESSPTGTEAGGTGEQTPIVMPDTTAGRAGTSTTQLPATPTDLPDSDYPDVVVRDLAGSDVNLRTLALESNPVLLWFWAPH